MFDFNFHGMDIGQFALWFFIYAFLGWCMECVVIHHQLGRWENRGFAKLPFCVIYAFGIFFAMILFTPIKDNYLVLYIVSAISATSFEYLVGVVMLKLFGEIWWNYDHLRFNYKGILCLQSTIGWGFLGLFVFGIFNDYLEGFVMTIDSKPAAIVGFILTMAYICDFSYHFAKRLLAHRNDERVLQQQEERLSEINCSENKI